MPSPHTSPLRRHLYEVIFETRTPAGRIFDIALLITILASVLVVLLKSVPGVAETADRPLRTAEWLFTFLFTIEYLVRLSVVAHPRRYAGSFFGVVDLVAVLPSYLSLFFPGAQVLLIIRMVRLIRVFHVLNLRRYEAAANKLATALRETRFPLTVFFSGLVVITVLLGSVMYLVEGPDSGFTSVPAGIYWAAVTVTTIGYGDLVPQTPLGRGITTVAVGLSYWVLAVPVAVVSVELSRATMEGRGPSDDEVKPEGISEVCPTCDSASHPEGARYCPQCGRRLS